MYGIVTTKLMLPSRERVGPRLRSCSGGPSLADHDGPAGGFAGDGNAKAVSRRELVDKYLEAEAALKASNSISQRFPAGLGPLVQTNLLRSISCIGLLPFPASSITVPPGIAIIHLCAVTSQRNPLSLTYYVQDSYL